MKYTSGFLPFIFSVILISLAGCGQITIKERGSQALKTKTSVTGENVESDTNLERTPNPYLQQRYSVPGEALKLFKASQSAMQQANWKSAEDISQKLVQQYPKLSGPYVNLGIIALATGQSEKQAEAFFSQAVNVNSDNLEAYNQLARLKRRQGLFREAEALYLKALGVWPQHPATHRNLGILYDLYLNDLVKAQGHYETYQNFLLEPDQQVAGWLIDIKRRVKAVAQAETIGASTP